MPPASNEEQFKFLISCIRYSNNGKVDFTNVAKECGIISKGAAAKRYERLMRAHGIASSSNMKTNTPRTPKPERRDSVNTSAAKKRKLIEQSDALDADDEEQPSSRVKNEGGGRIPMKYEEGARRQNEDMAALAGINLQDNADLLQYYGSMNEYAGTGGGSMYGAENGFDGSEFGGSNDGYMTPCVERDHSMFGGGGGSAQQQPYFDMGYGYSHLSNGVSAFSNGSSLNNGSSHLNNSTSPLANSPPLSNSMSAPPMQNMYTVIPKIENRSENHSSMQYQPPQQIQSMQPMLRYPDNQGHPESPVIVE